MGRVLVVEDDDDNRGFLQELLLLDTHEVHTACNGLEALTWLRTQRTLPHCIVLDLDMPIMRGEEFFRRLRDDPRFAEIRVIILSGEPHRLTDNFPPTVARLEKPTSPEMLTDVVARCTEASHRTMTG